MRMRRPQRVRKDLEESRLGLRGDAISQYSLRGTKEGQSREELWDHVLLALNYYGTSVKDNLMSLD
jgi:hypothetical protein